MWWFLILAVIVGFIRGGKFSVMPKFRFAWILIPVALMQVLALPQHSLAPLLVSVSYALTLIFLAVNWSYEEVRILLIGTAANALVIWANGGSMPVLYGSALTHFLPSSDLSTASAWHNLLSSHSRFPLLADIMYIPYPVPDMMSFGDIFIAAGGCLLIQRLMNKPVPLSHLANLGMSGAGRGSKK